jgi:hypothetical protein
MPILARLYEEAYDMYASIEVRIESLKQRPRRDLRVDLEMLLVTPHEILNGVWHLLRPRLQILATAPDRHTAEPCGLRRQLAPNLLRSVSKPMLDIHPSTSGSPP